MSDSDKFYIEQITFINRAPFENITIDFKENGITVLSAFNGHGKTTILSHLADAFHEIAKQSFPKSFEGKENKLYRVSSGVFSLDQKLPSIFYLHFRLGGKSKCYLDFRDDGEYLKDENDWNEWKKSNLHDWIISFSDFSHFLKEERFFKNILPKSRDTKEFTNIFEKNICTYFPVYRFEQPVYLNDPYQIDLSFNIKSKFSGLLSNPIEVISGLPQLTNWLMDVVLDMYVHQKSNHWVVRFLNQLISTILLTKIPVLQERRPHLRFGISERWFGGTRVGIYRNTGKPTDDPQIYPNVFGLSSGEAACLVLFGEVLRQKDNIYQQSFVPNIDKDKEGKDIFLSPITGVVLVDEIDKHLHASLQKEVLPTLLSFFPNVQFIVSSHSPFLMMGLSENETTKPRAQFISLVRGDENNISVKKVNTDSYQEDMTFRELCEIMGGEHQKLLTQIQALENELNKETDIPLVLTEGKTDVIHLEAAKRALKIDVEIEFRAIDDFVDKEGGKGDGALWKIITSLVTVKEKYSRPIIGAFDRDKQDTIKKVEEFNAKNNVFAFCISKPPHRNEHESFSLEFYYEDEFLRGIYNVRRFYFVPSEIGICDGKNCKHKEPKIKLRNKDSIFESHSNKRIYEDDAETETKDALTKANFAEEMREIAEGNDEARKQKVFEHFQSIFDEIKKIIKTVKEEETQAQIQKNT
jgi:hypothetical protein